MRRAEKIILTLWVMLLGVHVESGGYEVKHPALRASVSESAVPGLSQAVARAMAMSDEQLAAFNTEETDFYSIGCPNCTGGTAQSQLVWTIDDPDRVKCRYCRMVFPNEKYPMDKAEEVVNPLGVTQRYPYHLGPNGFKYFFGCKALYGRRQWLKDMATKLALLYHATKDATYAHKAAVILNRCADVYPSLCVHGPADYGLRQPTFYPPGRVQMAPPPADGIQPVPTEFIGDEVYRKVKTPYPYLSMRCGLGEWFYDEIPEDLVRAYDLICPSGELEKLSATVGKDVKRNIEGFFRATANYVRTYPRYLSNMEPTLIRTLSVAGQVIGEPEFVHDALIRAKLMLAHQVFADGFWREGAVSYHQQSLGGLRYALDTVKGYSDPPGYVGREDKLHLENVNPEAEVPLLGLGDAAVQKLAFPNGEYAALHDTWTAKTMGRERLGTKPLAESRPELLWAYGHAVLGRGKGEHQMQAHLHFSGAYGHQHADNLNLILFAKGREMLADIGYTHTVLRTYASWSAAHNLVLIDERDQLMGTGTRGGSLVAFDAPSDKIQFVEVDGKAVYPDLATQYRRTLVIVAVSDADAYVLDVFRVSGGRQHDWFVHGSADDSQELTSDLKLTPRPDTLLGPGGKFKEWPVEWGPNVADGRNNSYGLIRDVRATKTDETWAATFAYADAPQKQLRVTMLGQPGTEVVLARSPAIRAAKENNADIYRHWRPVIVARRHGENLQSVFATVHEPFEDQPFIRGVQRPPADGGTLALRVESAAGVDYHVLCPSDDAHCELRAEQPLALAGRYGFIRVLGGKVVAAYLLDGTELAFGAYRLSAEPCPKGRVDATRAKSRDGAEDALVVSPAVRTPAGQLSQRVIVEFSDGSTYGLLAGMRNEAGKTVVLLAHDPGFEVAAEGQKARLTGFPHREIAGEVKFRMPNSVWRE